MNSNDPIERLELRVAELTNKIDRLATQIAAIAFPLETDPAHSMTPDLAQPPGATSPNGRDLLRRARAPLPDPRLVHRIIRQRRLRQRYFEAGLFADPAWDILLDLTAARAEHRRVSVTSLCIAADVPSTTALRWIAEMTEMGLLVRKQDPDDKRRTFITLTDDVASAMARFFDELGSDAVKVI
ncbi:winged helix DNA-binding protein [Qipengyuania sediminis]|uniref:winged helix DNA-binding protein n=1 Tax=Qipengyuania sediminis TaxID=1532023 RepID=UPI00105A5A2F|nr:winged helix DNA-binding protein [Qipengyuania sediminis]